MSVREPKRSCAEWGGMQNDPRGNTIVAGDDRVRRQGTRWGDSKGRRPAVVADDTRLGGASHGGGDGQDVVVNDNVMMYDG